MEQNLKLLKDLNVRIARSFTNFKKSPSERITNIYVQTRLENLEQLWVEFKNAHQSVIEECDEDDLEKTDYFKNDSYEKTEDIYIEYKCALRKYLTIKQWTGSVAQAPIEGVMSSSSAVKLPKITIPKFSGKYEEWTTFRDLFTSLIHSNDSLDNVQKLHYLKGYLTGEAEQLIRQIPTTANNYEQCWNQIEKRFNNKRYLCNCILKRLFHHNICKSESALALKELLDNTNECLHALNNLGINTTSWDLIVIYIVTSKLDTESRRLWEVKVSELPNELPTLSNFTEFMEQRFRSLEFLDAKTKTTYTKNLKSLHIAAPACIFCSETHKLCNCKKFSNENVDARRKFVQANSLCFNCLGENHTVFSCRQSSRCRVCRKKHHSLLHLKLVPKSVNSKGLAEENDGAATAAATSQSDSVNVVSCFSDIQSQSLLATALVRVETVTGTTIVLRALLDQGSQASFISESAVQLLGLRKVPMKASISRLGDNANDTLPCKAVVEIKVRSRLNQSFVINLKAYVLSKLTSLLPERKLVNVSSTLSTMDLADPSYGTPNKIDLILGTGVYSQILLDGLIKGSPGEPIAQKTTLGWILSGEVYEPNHHSFEQCHNTVVSLHVRIDENDLLKRFWELESYDSLVRKNLLTDEEEKCEKIFSESTKRDESGRYIVKLPFKSEDPSCKYSGSKNIAHKRFYALERKFLHNPEFQGHYASVINDYVKLNHMEPVPQHEIDKPGAVYLAHHAVLRSDKSTKLRIVFDASCPGTNGASLNSDLMVGPSLQPDLRHIIMRWRRHPIALVADIIKMYRQVKVFHDDADYQRLLWRDSPESEIQHFRLLRVTFGTSSAPYLAVRCLQQLAYDEGHHFPSASERVLKDFYVDDLMTGCESVSEGKEIYEGMNQLLSRGGFQLQKWSSSNAELLKEAETDVTEINNNLEIKSDEILKILGLSWIKSNDEFKYTVQLPALEKPVTKRRAISDIARLYDPLGWIAPCVITAKIFIQKFWLSGIGWDDEIPHQLLNEWMVYRDSLSMLTNFRLPRWLGVRKGESLQLEGFCDASTDAYAAVVYAKVVDAHGMTHVNLVTSKTKVSPIKQVSIPRLELCGAVLLAKLLHEVADVLEVTKENVHAWTDSSVVLAWLRSHPSRWKTFVANRVSEILTLMDANQWSHVQSSDNPADCASRGISPSELVELELWKSGPAWLKNKEINHSTGNIKETDLEVRKNKVVSHALTCDSEGILSKYSSLTKLTRVIAYCRRFLRMKPENKNKIKTTWLNADEINEALLTCIKLCQARYFKDEIESLKKLGRVKPKGILTSLSPYFDENDVLRVGSRLRNAKMPEDQKNPVLIPHASPFTDLLIACAHEQTLHGGPQLMLNYLRRKYWVIRAKGLVRNFVRKCVTCIRHAAHSNQQLMGQLPEARATACRPFSKSGVDYAGPISVRSTKGRGYRSTKGYICIFVCMSTRAIHLEVVSDMTSEAFLAAFKRFTARRGHCSDLWSDNGTTFVGANKELQNLVSQEKSSVTVEIAQWLGNNGTNWHFIPPHSPNFGGLWESGVKSTKHHLKRTIGNHTLTFEEMITVLSQVEACLNSRPLSQISNNPEDPLPLTPGHFLVGEPLVLPPDCNFETSKVSSLKRWHLTQRLIQDFWRRWSHEYLEQFYHRYKWSHVTPEPSIGDIVLVKENDLPPARWLYGIITQKHTGLDNLTRVVSLRCKGTTMKRPVSKLIVLPITK